MNQNHSTHKNSLNYTKFIKKNLAFLSLIFHQLCENLEWNTKDWFFKNPKKDNFGIMNNF